MMATFKMDGIDEFSKALEELGSNADDIAKKAVNEAVPIMKASIKSSAAQSVTKGYSTGALVSGIKSSKAKINSYGVYAAVTISGTDAKGTRNGEKAAYLEYGTSKQPARPFMKRGVKNAEGSAKAIMEQVFESEVNKYAN
ncbi:MAG: HK97 gp10 family phage protein [Clostridiales bacterium]|nr:HK97 gp10 family phage protein [Clostridiales bacterium]